MVPEIGSDTSLLPDEVGLSMEGAPRAIDPSRVACVLRVLTAQRKEKPGAKIRTRASQLLEVHLVAPINHEIAKL